MIVAEFCDLIKKSSSKNDKFALSHALGSYYNEFQIINYLGEDIYALDYENQYVKIKPQEGVSPPKDDERCIIIQYRSISGLRQIGSMGIELTPAERCVMTIPRSVLLQGPVFVEELNALLYNPSWHPTQQFHPHSQEYISREYNRIRYEVAKAAIYNPITIMANDPSGRIKSLYIEINGRICSVKVTNFNTEEDDSDVFNMCVRGAITDSIDDCEIIRTTFSELFRDDPRCWQLGGFWISTDPVWLRTKLKINQIQPVQKTVSIDEVDLLLERARAEDRELIETMREKLKEKDHEVKDLKARYKTLNESYDDLVKGGYIDRNSHVTMRRLDLEESKIEATVEEAKINKRNEWFKLSKEIMSAATAFFKVLPVIISVAVALYVKFGKMSTA